jgi:hypothetical protein
MSCRRAAPPSRAELTEAGAEDDGAGEGDHAADGVDDRRAGEVTERHRHRGQPATRTPDPVAEDRVDEAAHADAVEQVALEAGAADHGTRGDGRARVGEGELEQEEGHERDARGPVRGRRAVQEEELVTDELVPGAEHEREADGPEQDAAERRVDDALEEDVADLPGPGEAGLQHHEPGLHEEDQEGRHQRPDRVQRVDHVLGGRRIRGALRAGHRVEERCEDLQGHQQEHDAEHLADEVHREEATRFLLAGAFLELA